MRFDSYKAPRDIAPNLYKLAWRKNRTVRDDLQDSNWTRGLRRMTTMEEMAEMLILESYIRTVRLNDQQDVISWKLTASGQYTTKSAYGAQLIGSYCTFDSKAIWKAKVEGKHRFFAWLLVQCKILTADKLLKRNRPCDPLCQLCHQVEESAGHLILHCVYAKEVWLRMSQETNGLMQVPSTELTMEEWWNLSLQGLNKELKQRTAALMIYTAWNIWKERNRRIFEGIAALPAWVVTMIKEEVNLRNWACGGGELLSVS
ncbi:hypothetical protein HU200_029954 [Digitaria exilis]|uniref:Reverse transcriptase zinc-binding domain-containing protein n=1 Tax=Digitaria exilis TaxID=1010633 RepID=A0A835BXJ0_9POAL|nr:hypothetical protein HU200_029954 [Digitaria exilis]